MEFKQILPTPNEVHKGKNTCEFIVTHHTGTGEGTIKGVLDGLYKRKDYASCHYIIDTNGDVYKLGKDTDILFHAGVSNWKGKSDLNKYSIGIEIIGPLSNGGFTDLQRESHKQLVIELAKTYNIPRANWLRHKDIAPKRKNDISDTFWNGFTRTWDEYKDFIYNQSIMTEFMNIMNKELNETGFPKILSGFGNSNPITVDDTKALINIALCRTFEKLKTGELKL